MFRAGQQVGLYTLVCRIGRGGFGEVWLAERRAKFSTTRVAVKLPLDEQVDHAVIRNEAELWVQASGHPNVLPIIEANDYDGQVVIVSEYAPDGSLEDLLRAKSPLAIPLKTAGELLTVWSGKDGRGEDAECCKLSVPKAVEMLTDILSGLKYLHDKKIIHRDLKPANILLQGDTPRLADFGISRVIRTSNSLTPNIAGTPRYMAPEAFNGQRNARTDIWSVGVLFYQTLTGGLPFPQEHYGELIGAITTGAPAPLPDTVPAALQRVILKALSNDPARRYQSADEFRNELKKAYRPPTEPVIDLPPPAISPAPPEDDLPSTLKAAEDKTTELDITPQTAQPEPAPLAHLRRPPTAEEPAAVPQEEQVEQERPQHLESETPPRGRAAEARGRGAARTSPPVRGKGLTAFLLLPLLLSIVLAGLFTSRPLLPRTTSSGYSGSGESAALSPDGRTVASAGGDGTAKLWDARVPDAGALKLLLVLAAAWVLTILIHISGMAAAGLLVRAPLEEISFFIGPRLLGLTLRGVAFNVRLIPNGGFVRFGEEGFQALSAARRLVIACSGELSLVLVAMAAFGAGEGAEKFLGGFRQVVAGAFSPLALGSEYLLALYEFARANPFWLVAGLLAAKVAAFNLLPVPTLNGGVILLTLAERFLSLFGVTLTISVRERIQQIGFLLLLVVLALWLVALFTFLGRVLV